MAMISLVGESQAGGVIEGPGAVPWTFAGKPFSLLGDRVAGHGNSPHDSPTMVEGSSWFTWNGVPVVVEGCKASCGHAANGNAWFDLPK